MHENQKILEKEWTFMMFLKMQKIFFEKPFKSLENLTKIIGKRLEMHDVSARRTIEKEYFFESAHFHSFTISGLSNIILNVHMIFYNFKN